MSRPSTEKEIVQYVNCPCGQGCAFLDYWNITEAKCKQLGYSKKVQQATGKPYFFRYINAKTCPETVRHRLIFTELYPMNKPLPAQEPEPITGVTTELY